MKRVIVTVVLTVVVMLAIPLVVFATGVVDMGATSPPGSLERLLASFAVQQSMAVRAPEQTNPFAGDAQAISTGLDHYAAMCVRCHGGPGVKPDEFAQGLNPPAPDLEQSAAELTDGELFWITKHGIRMTGMPSFGVTHDDDKIWQIAAAVKQLPNLSAQQKQQLEEHAGESHEHAEHDHGNQQHQDQDHVGPGDQAPNGQQKHDAD